ncbi:MAG TPA: MFS transporter [Bryocella sp.]|nr:MFS transporter [Bryocella sp.]
MSEKAKSSAISSGPSLPWLAVDFLLAGLGTVLLGPLLPSVAHAWSLTDAQSGLLLLAKFVGAFLGGVTVPRRLGLGIFAGSLLAFGGFTLFALSSSLLPGCAALFVSGIGLGQIIASTNILTGRRYRTHTGSALSSLNFLWSFGAVITGVLVGAFVPRFGLRNPLLCFAALYLVSGMGGAALNSGSGADVKSESEPPHAIAAGTIAFFALLLFLYGGLETCLTAWITTFTIRFSDLRLLGGQSGVVLMWASLTGGRALSSIALRHASEQVVQRVGLLLVGITIAVLGWAHHGWILSACCILIGLGLAPFFPATFAVLMRKQPPARTAGFVLAVSGLGAALFPWMMGVLSTQTGSLRIAMTVPWTLAVVLLLLSLVFRSTDAFSTPRQGEGSVKVGV